MSVGYEEILEGLPTLRQPPNARHELVCDRLHAAVAACLTGNATSRLLSRRTQVALASGNSFRPDLALLTSATGKLWLAAEIVNAGDHHPDTVVKKALYEESRLARLWMIDPRYDNVEVYHGSEYGLILKGILAGHEQLAERLLPTLQVTIAELFKP
jgi:hypothetical protein